LIDQGGFCEGTDIDGESRPSGHEGALVGNLHKGSLIEGTKQKKSRPFCWKGHGVEGEWSV